MCVADAHGIPYDRYLSLAFEYAFDAKWEYLPQPSMLYADRMVAWVVERWDAEKRELLRLACDPLYDAASYQGHPFQTDYQSWAMRLISARPIPSLPLAQYLVRERRLVPKMAIEHFGPDTVRQAIARTRSA